jgi:GEVED domain/Secretion system C-terminal sorting domain
MKKEILRCPLFKHLFLSVKASRLVAKKTSIGLLIAVFFLFKQNISLAQVSNYAFAESAGSYAALAGTNSTATSDDGTQDGIPIGFSFTFGGVPYTHFCISTNGWIKLGNATTVIGGFSYSNALSNTAVHRPLIAALWDDNHRNTGALTYSTTGAAPNRILTVDWNNVNIGGGGSTSATDVASYQIKIYETTSVVEIIYSNTLALAGSLSASVGLNDNTSFLSVTPGAPGTVSNSVANDNISATTDMVGKKYTFTPPSCSSPGGITASAVTQTTATISWAAVAGATGYEWAVTTSATPPASGTTTALISINVTALTAATNYFAHIRTKCGAAFSGWSTFSFFTSILNDECSGATNLSIGNGSCGTTISATSAGATQSSVTPIPTCGVGSDGYDDDVWFKFTPAAGQTIINIDFTSISGDNDFVAQIYSTSDNTCAGTFTTLACSDDEGPGSMPQFVAVAVTSGTTYYVRVFTYSTGVDGAFSICAFTPPSVPTCVTNVTPANGATGIVLGAGASTAITWNASATATSYDIYFGTVNPPTTNLGNFAAPLTTINIINLQYDTTYYWYLVPINGGGAAIGCNTNTTSFTVQSALPNCLPIYGTGAGQNCSGGDLISLFRLKGESSELNINTGTVCNNPSGYVDSTDHPVIISMVPGKSYWGQVQCGFSLNTIAIWIDFNNNGLFEVSEKLMNNLVVGTTLTNINIFIPLGSATGNHRMRVRNVYSPNGPISACAYYRYGETEDYTINIASSGSIYNVATYVSTGSCYTGAGDIVVDALSNNNNAVIALVDSTNNIIAQLYPDGNNLGRVSTSYYKHNSGVRQNAAGIYYLGRNITITVATPPSSAYRLRYFYQNAELNALIAQAGSGVTSQFDIKCTKNSNGCVNAVAAGGAGVLVTPTGFGTLGTDRFVDMQGLTGFSSFYLHGGNIVLPIKVEYLRGTKQGNNHLLDWKVGCSSSQFANLSMELSADSRNFSSIYSSRETALRCQQPFSFVNTQPLAGISYYRLKMTDDNGEIAYSNIVALLNKTKGFEFISIAPNPVTDGTFKLNITSAEQKKMEILVSDIAGRVVIKQVIKLIAGFNAIDMNVTNLAKGIYNIQGIIEGEKTKIIRFVKQ